MIAASSLMSLGRAREGGKGQPFFCSLRVPNTTEGEREGGRREGGREERANRKSQTVQSQLPSQCSVFLRKANIGSSERQTKHLAVPDPDEIQLELLDDDPHMPALRDMHRLVAQNPRVQSKFFLFMVPTHALTIVGGAGTRLPSRLHPARKTRLARFCGHVCCPFQWRASITWLCCQRLGGVQLAILTVAVFEGSDGANETAYFFEGSLLCGLLFLQVGAHAAPVTFQRVRGLENYRNGHAHTKVHGLPVVAARRSGQCLLRFYWRSCCFNRTEGRSAVVSLASNRLATPEMSAIFADVQRRPALLSSARAGICRAGFGQEATSRKLLSSWVRVVLCRRLRVILRQVRR